MHQAWSCCPVSSTPPSLLPDADSVRHCSYQQTAISLAHLLYPIWAYLTEDDIRLSTQLACAELLLSGAQPRSTTITLCRPTFPTPSLSNASGRSLRHPHSDLQGIDEPWRIGWGPSARQCYSNRRRHLISRKIDCQVAQSSAGAKTQIALAPCSPFSVSET